MTHEHKKDTDMSILKLYYLLSKIRNTRHPSISHTTINEANNLRDGLNYTFKSSLHSNLKQVLGKRKMNTTAFVIQKGIE